MAIPSEFNPISREKKFAQFGPLIIVMDVIIILAHESKKHYYAIHPWNLPPLSASSNKARQRKHEHIPTTKKCRNTWRYKGLPESKLEPLEPLSLSRLIQLHCFLEC